MNPLVVMLVAAAAICAASKGAARAAPATPAARAGTRRRSKTERLPPMARRKKPKPPSRGLPETDAEAVHAARAASQAPKKPAPRKAPSRGAPVRRPVQPPAVAQPKTPPPASAREQHAAQAAQDQPPPGSNFAKARKSAKSVAGHLKNKGRAGYDRQVLAAWQTVAGIAPDGIYGRGSAAALKHFVGARAPKPFFAQGVDDYPWKELAR